MGQWPSRQFWSLQKRGTCELRGVDGTTVLCINESSIVAIENLRILFGAEDSDSPSDSQASSNRRLLSLGTQYQRAIEVDGSDLSVQDFTLSDAVGGGVSIRGNGTLRVDNSTFRENKAMEAATNGLGGAIDLQGEANLIISSSFFTANRANEGGAMYVRYATGVEIYNSTFRNNVAEIGTLGAGTGRGGVLVLQSHGSVVIHDSNFAENLADTHGGQHGGGMLIAAWAIPQQTNCFTVGNAYIAILVEERSAGAIYLSGAQLFVLQCAFTDNACSKMGGALFAGGATGNSDTRISVRLGNVTFDGNSADVSCCFALLLCTIEIASSSMLAHNVAAGGGGGGIFLLGELAQLHLDHSQVELNNASEGGGGLMITGGAAASITNSSQLAGNADGAVYVSKRASLEISDSTVTGNLGAPHKGFAGIGLSEGAAGLLEGVLLDDQGGTAVWIGDGSSATLLGVVLARNTVADELGEGSGEQGVGAGVLCHEGGSAVLRDCHLEANLAANGPAIHASGNLTVSSSSFVQNAAFEDGAVYVRMRDEVTLKNVSFRNNTASNGAALYLAEGDLSGGDAARQGGSNATMERLSLSEIDMHGNHASEGGILFWAPLNLMGNGGAVAIAQSDLEVEDCVYASNAAGSGGALYGVANSTVTMFAHTLFENNFAYASGGAMFCSGGSDVNITDAIQVSFNRGEQGAGLFIGDCAVHILNGSWLYGNAAVKEGGGVFMHTAHSLEERGVLLASGLIVEANGALQYSGAGIAASSNSLLALHGASLLSNRAHHGSGVPTAPITEAEAAGLRAASVHEEAAGGYPLQQPVVVELVDLYGTVVSTAEPVEVRVNSSCGVQGTLCVPTRCGVAEFRDLVLSGPGGSRCVLRHTADTSGAEGLETSTVVPLRYCLAGERYTSTRECVRCAAGSLSFDNDTESCHDCGSQSGIRCPGAADYEFHQVILLTGDAVGMEMELQQFKTNDFIFRVLPGYWLPPIANACETASCLVSLVEACQVEDACDTTSSQRSASGAHAANDLALCATSSGYTTGVLCGGTLPTSCSSGSYSSTEGDACLSCPSKGAVIGQLLVTVVIGVAINFLSGYGLMVTSEQALKAADPDEFRETAEEIADPEDEMQYPGQLWTIIGLVIGYFQVGQEPAVHLPILPSRMFPIFIHPKERSSDAEHIAGMVIGEFPNLFSSDVVPDAFNAYTRHLFVFKPNLSAMLNAPCLEYHLLSSGSNTSPFWLLFFQAVLTPWIVMLAAWLLYSTTAFFFQRRHGLQGAEAERARTVIGRKVAAMVLFAFTALHPSVSTTVMSLFDCRDIWYEDAESKQSWVRQDTSIECGNWDVGPVLALLTILYLPAFPLGIAGYMWWARGYVKCRITRGGADDDLSRILEHGWVINGWKESMEVGQGSWRWLPQSRPLSQFSQFLNPLRNVPASSSAPPGDDDTDDDSEHGVIVMTGLEESENSEEEEEQRALDDEPPYVDVYLHASLILLDHVSVGASWRTGDICWERASTEDDEPGVRRKGVVIKWPQTKLPAEVYIKEVKGDGGAADYVPVTWLDSAKVLQTLGAVFIEPFASHLYLWNTYEIGRRFLQTAGVLVVAVALDSTSAMAYATLISVAALSIHLRVAPFKADADDFLMTAILANQFICQFSIMCIKISDANIR
eukprot:gene5135-6247_t